MTITARTMTISRRTKRTAAPMISISRLTGKAVADNAAASINETHNAVG